MRPGATQLEICAEHWIEHQHLERGPRVFSREPHLEMMGP